MSSGRDQGRAAPGGAKHRQAGLGGQDLGHAWGLADRQWACLGHGARQVLCGCVAVDRDLRQSLCAVCKCAHRAQVHAMM